MSEQPNQPAPATPDYLEDEMSVAESIGEDEGVQVGHAGAPIFWVVCVVLILCWAMVAWKPWKGY
ncbi:MAG: hypothetical protein IT204_09460 [Fimbriimonadaceae bacterium]|nr:hypothetical protein [Fimbriimonadaceae bacterium]